MSLFLISTLSLFDGGVCLRVVACSWRSDAAGVFVARGRNDCRHRDDNDPRHQSSPAEWLAGFLYLPEVLYLVILIWLSSQGLDGSALIICFCREYICSLRRERVFEVIQ